MRTFRTPRTWGQPRNRFVRPGRAMRSPIATSKPSRRSSFSSSRPISPGGDRLPLPVAPRTKTETLAKAVGGMLILAGIVCFVVLIIVCFVALIEGTFGSGVVFRAVFPQTVFPWSATFYLISLFIFAASHSSADRVARRRHLSSIKHFFLELLLTTVGFTILLLGAIAFDA